MTAKTKKSKPEPVSATPEIPTAAGGALTLDITINGQSAGQVSVGISEKKHIELKGGISSSRLPQFQLTTR